MLLKLDKLCLAFGHVDLLNHVSFSLDKNERVCLLGRNGEGKSSFLKIMEGSLLADSGSRDLKDGCRVAYMSQEPEFEAGQTIHHAVAAGLGNVGELLNRYHDQANALATECSDAALAALEETQHALEAANGWSLNQRVETLLTRLALPAELEIANLSGGWKRRVALAQVLVQEPDILLLDEPTNHLDIETISWLEDTLNSFSNTGALLFISHDRAFVKALATRILELDRGNLRSYPGDYVKYQASKQTELEVEALQAAKFDKRLAQEEVWIRQGVKARRTRNEGRVRALESLRAERSQRRTLQGSAKLNLDSGDRSGKLVIEAKHIQYGWDDKVLIDDFSTVILRGDRIGLVGPNGVGKTTLLKILLGDLEAKSGTLHQGTKLKVAYFDQLREQLDPEQSVMDAVADGNDFVEIQGQRKHVLGYLGDFLFPPARARSPIKALSGGERNRLLLARLFTRPANLLVMDEPTNDLDVDTLELLEDLLMDYPGTLLLVSHDRAFIDQVVTSCWVFEGDGQIKEYVGGYSDWQATKARQAAEAPQAKPTSKAKAVKKNQEKQVTKAKLSYNEQRELDAMPKKIERLESEQTDLNQQVSAADFYQQDEASKDAVLQRLGEIDAALNGCFERWEVLEV